MPIGGSAARTLNGARSTAARLAFARPLRALPASAEAVQRDALARCRAWCQAPRARCAIGSVDREDARGLAWTRRRVGSIGTFIALEHGRRGALAKVRDDERRIHEEIGRARSLQKRMLPNRGSSWLGAFAPLERSTIDL